MPEARRHYSTVNVDNDQHALIRAAVRRVQEVTGREYTQAQFTRDAFDGHLRAIWREFNDGKPIPPAP